MSTISATSPVARAWPSSARDRAHRSHYWQRRATGSARNPSRRASSPRRISRPSRRRGAQRLRAGDAGQGAGDGRRRRRAARPGARAARWKARRSASRTCSAPRACARPPARRSSASFKPTYKSTVTANLWRDGAVMLGKLNMDEFAMGSSNETSPRAGDQSLAQRDGGNGQLTPGGSSGGSAAAVAAGSAWAPRPPTPAARSASRPPSPARSASSRPTAAARAGASSPSPRRWTRPGRSPRRSRTPRSC